MVKNVFSKSLVFGIIVLFIGTSIIPAISININQSQETNKIELNKIKSLDLTDSLVGYWNFDEGSGIVAHDSSGNGNDGIINGATWATGKYGTALEIIDTNYVGNIPASFDDSITTAFSITAWIKWYGLSSYPHGAYIFDGRGSPAIGEGFIFYIGFDNKLKFWLNESTGIEVAQSTSTISIGSWTHVAAVFDDSSSLCRLYINGYLDNTTTITKSYHQNSGSVMIGNNHYLDGNWAPVNSIEDEIRIYNRVLSDIEIKQLAGIPPTVVFVDDNFDSSTSGWGYDHFDSIQDGIDAVNEEGTVFVYCGIYYEHVVVNKQINFFGENKANTIIDGSGNRYVISILAGQSVLNNFTIRNSKLDTDYNDIEVYGCLNIISNCSIYNCGCGIILWGYTNNNTIINCEFYNDLYGIITRYSGNCPRDNIIKKCKFHDNYDAITLVNTNYNTIENCSIYANYGETIEIQNAHYNRVINCNISTNNYFGCWIYDGSNYNVISRSIFSNNEAAICIFGGANNNTIYDNLINNNNIGISITAQYFPATNNKVYNNNFINNSQNAYGECINSWDNDYPSGGNYWDDYSGIDANGDGIGDTPYPIPGDSNQDSYPLITQYGPPHAEFTYTINDKNVLFDASLSYDYNGNIISYDWDFGDSQIGTGMTISHTYTNFGTYDVTLTVTDNDELTNETSKEIILVNNPPNTPSDPEPDDGATDVSVYAVLTWTCSDPDGDDLTYDVYFGTSSDPPLVYSDVSSPFFNPPGAMYYDTVYYWKIVAEDEFGASTTGPIWIFTTTSVPNDPPDSPSDPSPYDGEIDVNLDISLSWSCSNPEGDELVYDVYFEADDNTPDVKVSDDQNVNIFNPDTLQINTTYYWQIIAKDEHGASTPGPVWSFTTRATIPSPPGIPIINGPTSGKPGDYFTYTFVSIDPDDDNVFYQINWGDGTIEDWFGPYESNELVSIVHGWDLKGKFTIQARAKDVNGDIGGWGTLEVTIPRSKIVTNTFFQRFLQNHPNLLQFLQKLIYRLE